MYKQLINYAIVHPVITISTSDVKNEKRDRPGRSLRRCARVRVAPATALSFKPRVPLEGERVRQSRACERDASRAPSEPSGSLAETGPFSFLVIIEIGSQVLLLSRGAPLALITRCHAGLYTRMLSFKLARSISTPVMEWIFNVQWYWLERILWLIFTSLNVVITVKTICVFN